MEPCPLGHGLFRSRNRRHSMPETRALTDTAPNEIRRSSVRAVHPVGRGHNQSRRGSRPRISARWNSRLVSNNGGRGARLASGAKLGSRNFSNRARSTRGRCNPPRRARATYGREGQIGVSPESGTPLGWPQERSGEGANRRVRTVPRASDFAHTFRALAAEEYILADPVEHGRNSRADRPAGANRSRRW